MTDHRNTGVGLSRFYLGCTPERFDEIREMCPVPPNRWWAEFGSCGGMDPDLWFSVSAKKSKPDYEKAKGICAGCPVKRECFAEGLFDSYGMRGGYTRPERIKMIQGRRPFPDEMVTSGHTERIDAISDSVA